MAMIKRFEGRKIEIIPSDKHDFLTPTKDVAKGFGIRKDAIRHHKKNHADELLEGIHWIVKDIHGLPNTFWTYRGILRLANWIQSEQAKRFRQWYEDLSMQEIEKSNSAQQLLTDKQLLMLIEGMGQIVKSRMEDKKEVAKEFLSIKEVQHESNQALQAIANEIIDITKDQKNKIQVRRAEIVEKIAHLCPNRNTGELFSILGKIVNAWFGVPTYREIPRQCYIEAQNVYTCIHQLIAARKININEAWSLPTVIRTIRLLYESHEFPHYTEKKVTPLDTFFD